MKIKLALTIVLFVFMTFITSCAPMERAEPSIILSDNPYEGATLEGDLSVEFIGLSAGEATLVRSLNGPAFLIDTGHPDSRKELLSYLQREGITDLKALILTHFGEDYRGNAKAVLDSVAVEEIWVSSILKPYIYDPLWGFTGTVREIAPTDRLSLGEKALMKVLAPDELYLSPQNNSLVFQLRHKEIEMLFTSAINKQVERQLVKQFDLKSEVLKVSDFGSLESSDPSFIEEVDAQVAVLFHSNNTVGTKDEVMERLHETWIDVYPIKRNDSYRTIKVLSNGDNYEITDQKEDFN